MSCWYQLFLCSWLALLGCPGECVITDCKHTHLERDYNGIVSQTWAGYICLRWDSMPENVLSRRGLKEADFPGGSYSANENYCRNPDGDEYGPWCYNDRDGYRNTCIVPRCPIEGSLVAYVHCRGRAVIYIDGKKTGNTSVWTETWVHDIGETAQLIAVECYNGYVSAGLLASFSNGFTSDETWRCSSTNASGWYTMEFDDSDWNHPYVIEDKWQGYSWKESGNFHDDAEWIWKDEAYDRAGPSYCRGEIRALIWILRPQSVNATTLQTVAIFCKARGSSGLDTNYSWLINGRPINELPNDPRRKIGDFNLVFHDLTENDTMTVQCRASNERGFLVQDVDIKVSEEAACVGDSYSETQHNKDEGGKTGCSRLPSKSPVTDELQELLDKDIESNVNEVAKELEVLTSVPEILTHSDIAAGADILQKLTKGAEDVEENGDVLVGIANNLLNTGTTNMVHAEKTNRSSTKILTSLEEYSLTAQIDGNQTLIKNDDITLKMLNVDNETINMAGFGQQQDGSQETADYKSIDEVDFDKNETAIVMSDELQQQVKDYYEKPDQSDRSEKLRMAFAVYRKAKLFLTPEQLEFPYQQSAVNSDIIAMSLPMLNNEPLDGQVWAVFHPKQETNGTAICVYWEFNATEEGYGNWSTKGCSFNRTTTGGNVVCQCDHLTHFAILMNPNVDTSEGHKTALSAITYLGLGLSSLGLLLTILTFLVFKKKLRFGQGQKVLANLAVALLGVNVTFLAGMKRSENQDVCVAVAGLLHYLLLVAFAWMLVEAVLQYLRLVKVIGAHVDRFMLKAALPSWTLPAAPVIAFLCIHYFTDNKMYLGEYCWLQEIPLYSGFMAPIGLIIFVNTALYIRIIKSITCDRSANIRSTQSKAELTKLQICGSLSVFVLLGLTWVFGFLTMTDTGVVFHYVFCILNTFQGFLIFLFHTFMNKQTRAAWYKLICPSRQEGNVPSKKTDKTSLDDKQMSGPVSTLEMRGKRRVGIEI